MSETAVKSLTTDQLRSMRDESDNSPYIVNVLSREAYDEGHIPNSDNVPVTEEDFVEQVAERAGGKDKPVVVYCADLECSASDKAARKLARAGFEQIWDYPGGIDAWRQAGLPVQTGDTVESVGTS